MRALASLCAALVVLTTAVGAADIPRALEDYLPREVIESVGRAHHPQETSFLRTIAADALHDTWHAAARGACALLLIATLCSILAPFEKESRYVPLLGVLAVTTVAAGDLTTLLGLGAKTVEELGALGTMLLTPVSASLASGGMVGSASLWQVATMFASNLLAQLIRDGYVPLIRTLAGLSAAEAVLGDGRLSALRRGLQKLGGVVLCAILSGYSLYLAFAGALTGSVDRTAVRAVRTALTAGIPVVGGALSDAAEGILGAAETLRGTLGTLGVLAILSVSLAPLLHFAVQYLLYRAAAFFAELLGTKELRRALDGLAGAFALMLACVASCALLLTVSLLLTVTVLRG